MLRATYYVLGSVLMFSVCHQTSTYRPAIDNHSAIAIADGPAPAPPPLPLAVPLPQIQIADGPAPAPPPLPLAVPAFSVSPVQA